MVNEVLCRPRRTSLGRAGFETNKAQTQQIMAASIGSFQNRIKKTVPPLMRRHIKR